MRRVTIGRATALLLVGVILGALLFLRHRLSPAEVNAQVMEQLGRALATDKFSIGDVRLILGTGVEIADLRIRYPDDVAAVTAERITLVIDHEALLSGDVEVRQVDVEGLVVRLRPEREEVPGLPGILRGRDRPLSRTSRLPTVRVRPGRGGSRVVLERTGILDDDVPCSLSLDYAEAEADGPRYRVNARFHGDRVESLRVDASLDPDEGRCDVRAELLGLEWKRRDFARLHPSLLRKLPPVEVGGRAVRVDASLSVGPGPGGGTAISDLRCLAELQDLRGSFGDLHTGERVGLPYRVVNGTATVSYADGRLAVPDLVGTYVSPDGHEGPAGASVAVDFGRVGTEVDFTLRGRGLFATKEDLYHILEPEVVESVVKPFEPAGVFDFDVTVSRRPGLPEKVWVNLRMSDGQFNYAGQLDELTGRRFGFHYPLTRCSGLLEVETNVPTPRGLVQLTSIRDLKGSNAISRPVPGGPTHVAVEAKGSVVAYRMPDGSEPEDVRVEILVRDLPIDAKLATAFASTPRGMPYRAFDLSGWAETVRIHVEQRGFLEDEPRATYEVRLKDCSMAYERFPLHLRDITGIVTSRDLPRDASGRAGRLLVFRDLEGRAVDGGRVRGSGRVQQSETGAEEMELEIEARDLELGPDLASALERSPVAGSALVGLWRTMRPTGRVHGRVKVLSDRDARIEVDLGGTSGFEGYDGIDCPLTELEGTVSYDGDGLVLREVGGYLAGARFFLDGDVENDGGLDLTGTVDGLVLRQPVQDLVRRLVPEGNAGLAWVTDGDASSVDVAVHARRSSARDRLELDARLTHLDVATAIAGIPVRVTGGPLLLRDDALVAKDLWLAGGGASVVVREASVPREPDRYGWAVLDARDLHPRGHVAPLLGEAFARTLGEDVRADLTGFRVEFNRGDGTMILSGAIDLRRVEVREGPVEILEPTGALGLSPLTVRLPRKDGEALRFSGVVEFRGVNMNTGVSAQDLAGELRIAEGSLEKGLAFRGAVFGGSLTIFDRYADELSLNVEYRPDYLRLGNIDGRFYEGTLRGSVEVHLAEPGGFHVQLRASGIRLEEMLKEDLPRDSPYSGTIDAALDIRSASDEVQHMEGQGQIRLREGQLFRVPGMRSIIATLNRVTPLQTNSRFRTAEVDFTVGGETFDVRRLHFSTATNDVYCNGRVSVYGDLDLVVKPQVTRMLDLPRWINIPVLSTLLNLWHKTAYEIRLEGTIRSPNLRLRALPFLRGDPEQPFTQSAHAGRAGRMRPGILPAK